MKKYDKDLQQRIHQAIVDHMEKERGIPPTVREIGAQVGIQSTSHVDYYLSQLSDEGTIVRSSGKSRHIKAVRDAEGRPILWVKHTSLPMKGLIAAGEPLILTELPQETVEVSTNRLPKGAYVLKVKGDSMIEEGILDGDCLVIAPGKNAINGDVVVAAHHTVTDSTLGAATVKRFYKEENSVRLQPANKRMGPLRIPAEEWDTEWEIQGKVIDRFHPFH